MERTLGIVGLLLALIATVHAAPFLGELLEGLVHGGHHHHHHGYGGYPYGGYPYGGYPAYGQYGGFHGGYPGYGYGHHHHHHPFLF